MLVNYEILLYIVKYNDISKIETEHTLLAIASKGELLCDIKRIKIGPIVQL